MALHLASVILFQLYTQHMVHIPGRCVPQIIAFLVQHMTPENHAILSGCQGKNKKKIFKVLLFLALLDYVSRAHEIEICPSSVVRRPSSVVRVAIISEPTARISFKFHLWLLLDHSQDLFFYFKKKILGGIFYEYFSFLLTWDPMGVKISKRYSSYKSHPKAFKLFLNFLLNGPHKTTFGIFEILTIEILTNFFRYP